MRIWNRLRRLSTRLSTELGLDITIEALGSAYPRLCAPRVAGSIYRVIWSELTAKVATADRSLPGHRRFRWADGAVVPADLVVYVQAGLPAGLGDLDAWATGCPAPPLGDDAVGAAIKERMPTSTAMYPSDTDFALQSADDFPLPLRIAVQGNVDVTDIGYWEKRTRRDGAVVDIRRNFGWRNAKLRNFLLYDPSGNQVGVARRKRLW